MQTDAKSQNIASQQGLELLALVAWCTQTKATTANIFGGSRLIKEAMHSGTVILKIYCNTRAQTFSRGQPCCGFMQTGFAGHRTIEMLGLVAPKFNRSQTIRNKCQHCCGSTQTDKMCWAQQCCVLLANNVASVCMDLKAHLYADDTLQYFENSYVQQIEATLSEDLEHTVRWLNDTTKIMLMGTYQRLSTVQTFSVTVNDT